MKIGRDRYIILSYDLDGWTLQNVIFSLGFITRHGRLKIRMDGGESLMKSRLAWAVVLSRSRIQNI